LLIATLRRMRASDLPFRRFYEIGSCQKMFSRTESSYSPYKGLGGKIAPVSTTYAVAGCSIFKFLGASDPARFKMERKARAVRALPAQPLVRA
jgi:hypothetical protein